MSTAVEQKRCARCGESKPRTAFCRERDAKDGLHSWCRDCLATHKREWKARNPEAAKASERRAVTRYTSGLRGDRAWRQTVELQLREWLRLMDDAETPDEIAWVVASVSERIRAVLAGGEEFDVLVRKLAQAGLSEGDRG